jgi:streptomycin 6-kinase
LIIGFYVDVEEIRTRLTQRYGPQVIDWCAGVPALAERLADRWALTLGELIPDGASSVVLHCRLPQGTPAVLKLCPDRRFLAEQAAMLGWLAGSGRVPAVFASEPEGLLMEAIQPGTAADELPRPPTERQWAHLLTALHSVEVPPNPPRDLRARCEEFFARIGRRLTDPRIGARITPATWERALRRCRHLLDTQSTQVLLHGDLHLGNVLDAGPDRALVAIDPKVCVGDPCFDAVDYVLAAAGSSPDHNAVTTRCHTLADLHPLAPDRLHAWCQALAPIIAVSLIPTIGNETAIAELLTLAR